MDKREPEILESRPLPMRIHLVDPEDPSRSTPQVVQGTFTVFKTRTSTPSR